MANKQKWGLAFANSSNNFNAGFVKLTLYNIFSSILFNVFNWHYQTYSRKEIPNLFTLSSHLISRIKNKTSFVSLRCRFASRNKKLNNIKKKCFSPFLNINYWKIRWYDKFSILLQLWMVHLMVSTGIKDPLVVILILKHNRNLLI